LKIENEKYDLATSELQSVLQLSNPFEGFVLEETHILLKDLKDPITYLENEAFLFVDQKPGIELEGHEISNFKLKIFNST
jgi:hypothetical protein